MSDLSEMRNSQTDLIAFLRARLNEDEHAARSVIGVNRTADWINGKPVPRWVSHGDSVWGADDIPRVKGTWAREAAHIARWDPARALAEVEAKRRIIDLQAHGDGGFPDGYHEAKSDVLASLALPYADHPDYRPEWSQ